MKLCVQLFLFRVLLSALCVALASCTSAVQSGHNTALSGVDLVQMTDDMARKIVASPAVQSQIAAHGAMRVVVEPVVNLMQAEILPRGQADAFTARVRSLLSAHDPDQFVWIMNRDGWYRLRGTELENAAGPDPNAVQPEFALTATFTSLTNEDEHHRSSSYLCTYSLTDLLNRNELWSDKYEVKKTAVKGLLD